MSRSNCHTKVKSMKKSAVSGSIMGDSDFERKTEWTYFDPGILDGAVSCSDVINEYAISSVGNKRPSPALTEKVRKYLSFLGWKIEFINKDIPRFRYTSLEGKTYLSLYQVCLDLGNRTDSQFSQDEQSSMCSSNSKVIDQKKIKSCHGDDTVEINGEYCPQAIMDYYFIGIDKRDHRRKGGLTAHLIAEAKKHLSFMGWVFQYADKKGKRELHYYSPKGRCYYSLRTACKACMDEGEAYEATSRRGMDKGGASEAASSRGMDKDEAYEATFRRGMGKGASEVASSRGMDIDEAYEATSNCRMDEDEATSSRVMNEDEASEATSNKEMDESEVSEATSKGQIKRHEGLQYERLNFLDHTFLNFQDTVTPQQVLIEIPLTKSSQSTAPWLMHDAEFLWYGADYEGFQAEQAAEVTNVAEGSTISASGNSFGFSNGATQQPDFESEQCLDDDMFEWLLMEDNHDGNSLEGLLKADDQDERGLVKEDQDENILEHLLKNQTHDEHWFEDSPQDDNDNEHSFNGLLEDGSEDQHGFEVFLRDETGDDECFEGSTKRRRIEALC